MTFLLSFSPLLSLLSLFSFLCPSLTFPFRVFLRSILDCNDTFQLEEVLEFMCWHLYATQCEAFSELSENLLALGGPSLFLPLLRNESESVRVLVLEIIAKLILVAKQQEAERSSTVMFPVGSGKVKGFEEVCVFSFSFFFYSLFSLFFTFPTNFLFSQSEVFVAIGSYLTTFPFREKTQVLH